MAQSGKGFKFVLLVTSFFHGAFGSAGACCENSVTSGKPSVTQALQSCELQPEHMMLAISRGTVARSALSLDEVAGHHLGLEARLAELVGNRGQSDEISDRNCGGSEQDRHLKSVLAVVQRLAVGVVNGTEQLSEATSFALSTIMEEMQKIRNATAISHAEDQDEVDRARDDVLKCDRWALLKHATNLTTKEYTHAKCRSSEVDLNQRKISDCAKYLAAMRGLDPPDCMPSPVNVQSARSAASCMQSTAAWWQTLNVSATDLAGSCKKASAAHAGKKRLCDSAQTTYEATFCSYRTQLTESCPMHDKCRTSAAAELQQVQAKVQVAEASRKAQYIAAAQIECHLEVLIGRPEQQLALLEKCPSLQVPTLQLSVTYHEVPEGAVCDVSSVAIRPCQEPWLRARYTGEQWYSGAPTTACTPCDCSTFDCPTHYMLKEDAGTIPGNSVGQCCDEACSGFSCPAHHVPKAGATSIPGNTAGECCDELCSGFTCPAHYVLRADAASIQGNTTSQCCDKACSDFQCPAHYVLKEGAASVPGNAVGQCCDKVCSDFSCTNHYILKADAARIRGYTGALCCDKACSDFKCPAHYTLKEGAAATRGNTDGQCCDKVCSDFSCPSHYALKEGASEIRAWHRDQCCDQVCSGFTCPAHYVLKTNAGSIPGTSVGQCCDQVCSSFTCPSHYVLKGNPGSIRGTSAGQCCDRLCSGFTCPAHYVLKTNARSIAGTSAGQCCDQVCSSFTCPSHYVLKGNPGSIRGTSAGQCCDLACSRFTCPANYALKAGSSKISGSTRDMCCDQIRDWDVHIGRSDANTKCLDAPLVTCSSDAGNKGKRVNSHPAGDSFNIQVSQWGRVCATRLDYSGGWGMDLVIRCKVRGVDLHIGSSTANTKCLDTPALLCPTEAGNIGRRVNSHSAHDTFKISNFRNDGNSRVCAQRLDYSGGWGMDLMVRCVINYGRINIGRSSGVTKCVNTPSPMTCSRDAGNKGIRVNTDYASYGDTFNIYVNNAGQVCAKRLDQNVPWAMDLTIICNYAD